MSGAVEVKAEVLGLEACLRERIRGQDQMIPAVCSVLERGELGLSPPDRPRGSMLFLGPTGVGKTETALAFSEYLFGNGRLCRFDMSEFQHIDAVKNFIGDETGYLGRLGEVLKKGEARVLLFDEIEKAHRLIWDIFLQVLDAARITVGRGEVFDLSAIYVVFTSNIGSSDIMRQVHMPFTTVERFVLAKVSREMRPEFLARLQEILVFRKLDFQAQREIAVLTLQREVERFAKLGYQLVPSADVIEFLIRKGIDKTLGARPMRKTVEKHVGDAVRTALKEKKSGSGTLRVDVKEQALALE
jgi:ATP-dependent Clp protease ATP-binding subunit ClpA